MAEQSREEKTTHHLEIRICAEPSNLCVVRAAVRKAIEVAGLGEQEIDGVALALDEALSNVIQHGYGGACSKPIIVKLNRLAGSTNKAGGVELIVRDFGEQVDPSNIKSRDLEEIRPGGLGVHIIRSVMDEVEYSCPNDGGMQLRMVKYISSASGRSEDSNIDAVCG